MDSKIASPATWRDMKFLQSTAMEVMMLGSLTGALGTGVEGMGRELTGLLITRWMLGLTGLLTTR